MRTTTRRGLEGNSPTSGARSKRQVARGDARVFVWFRSLVVVAHEAATLGSKRPIADHERTPFTRLPADARLRSWVVGDYGGFDQASVPHSPVAVPATFVTPLVVDVSCSPSRPPVFVNGPSGTYTRVKGPCAPAVMVRLAPLGAYKLLGSPLSEIAGSIVGLEDIVGADARWLSEQVRSARTWEERGRLLNDFLLDRAARGPQPSSEVSQAWHLLVRAGGRTTIKGIARQVGWSHKHLITRFKQQVGVAPHLAARLVRLSTVWRHLDDTQSWARIAAECGYADQAHLIREFRRFTGTTPGALTTT
jgi:AraC-like DNA-binding protein